MDGEALVYKQMLIVVAWFGFVMLVGALVKGKGGDKGGRR